MDDNTYLTLQEEVIIGNIMFEFNTQFVIYREENDGYYVTIEEVEYGPIPKDVCFFSRIAIDQTKLMRRYRNEAGQDSTTDYYKRVEEVYAIDMKLNHQAQHNGGGVFYKDFVERKNKKKR